MKKIVFSDLDGTLFNEDMQVSEENLDAIKKMHDMGNYFVPSSGRTISEFPKSLTENSYVRYISHSNGAVVYDTVKKCRVFSDCISNEVMIKIMDILACYECYITVRQNGLVYVDKKQQTKELYRYYNVCEPHERVIGENGTFLDNFEEICRNMDDIEVMSIFFKNPADIEECKNRLVETGVLRIALAWESNIEISSIYAGKGNALVKLAEKIGVDIADTVAVGDSGNDVTMLEAAGLGLAVSNATEPAKSAADKIICSNEENIAVYIVENIL